MYIIIYFAHTYDLSTVNSQNFTQNTHSKSLMQYQIT